VGLLTYRSLVSLDLPVIMATVMALYLGLSFEEWLALPLPAVVPVA